VFVEDVSHMLSERQDSVIMQSYLLYKIYSTNDTLWNIFFFIGELPSGALPKWSTWCQTFQSLFFCLPPGRVDP